jgi:hypothetical protein
VLDVAADLSRSLLAGVSVAGADVHHSPAWSSALCRD